VLIRFWNYSPYYFLHCTPLGPITITNSNHLWGSGITQKGVQPHLFGQAGYGLVPKNVTCMPKDTAAAPLTSKECDVKLVTLVARARTQKTRHMTFLKWRTTVCASKWRPPYQTLISTLILGALICLSMWLIRINLVQFTSWLQYQ